MQKQDPIEEARRHPLVSYFKSREKEVPEEEIDRRWNDLARRLQRESAPRRSKVWRLYAEVACAAALLAGVLWGRCSRWTHPPTGQRPGRAAP